MQTDDIQFDLDNIIGSFKKGGVGFFFAFR